MKNRLIITVSDNKSTKSYNLHKIVKKILLITIILIVAIVIGGFYFINYLKNEINQMEIKKQELSMQNKLNALKIKDTLKDIESLSSTLGEIEDILGLKSVDKTEDLVKRVQSAKLTSVEKMKLLGVLPNGSPLKQTKVTSSFGYRTHPITKKRQFHRGIDLRARKNTKIYATADGVVRYVQNRNKGDFGRIVIIMHNYGFETVYAHLNKTKVKVGDIVKKGDLVALSGNSGRSTAPHLHYEIRYASRVLNPYRFIKWDLKNYDSIFKKEKRVPWESLVQITKN